MWTDSDLQRDIEKELAWEPSVHPKQIGVTVKAGAVTLGGHVDSYWERCVAERVAWRVAHVKAVANDLRVDLPFDAVRADDDIALAAMTVLEWNCQVPASVEVAVADGWLTLSGTADRPFQREEAEKALAELRGLRGIRNEIAVKNPPFAGDIKPLIDDALRRNAMVDSSHVKVHIANGVVSLRGTVRSRVERDEAMHAAWSAPGVTKVEDHLLIAVRGE